ncbi:MAG: DUF429 domain-containing protein [Alphaproteobacteria bacterium]
MNAKKRWKATALSKGGRFFIDAPVPVGDTAHLLRDLPAPALVGFDFPIGLPANYAKAAGIDDFKAALATLPDDWFDVCENLEDVSFKRPFFPKGSFAKGAYTPAMLAEKLGLSVNALRRAAERATGTATSLFWTNGPGQVGKGALAGWQEVIRPALDQQVAIWPFDGDLATCLKQPITLAEIYPGAAAKRLGAKPKSKTKQAERQAVAPALLRWCENRPIHLSDTAQVCLAAGFGSDDAFDAFVGLLSMIHVVLGHQAEAPPLTDSERRIEGWILGQATRG